MSIDLHIHSMFSDGTYTPTEIAHLAHKRGLTAISLTDHDTLAGIAELITAVEPFQIEAIPGIELSVVHGENHFHLLGYFVDHLDRELHKKIDVLQKARSLRNEGIVAKLNGFGIDITMDEINSISPIGQTGRPHIAEILCRKGVVKDLNTAFSRYLKKGAGAYVSRFVYSAAEAIEMIKSSGGLAVLAHPVQDRQSFQHLSATIDDLAELGLDGLEVYYPSHSFAVRKKLKEIAKRHDMIISGGSDYHGRIRPGTDLAGGVNVFVPPEILEHMKTKRAVPGTN